jgi:diacylglycerol kinase (ATP)
MKLMLVFNPNACSGRASQLLPKIRKRLSRFAEVDVMVTRERGHARDLVAQTPLEGYSGVIAAGGDGTLFEVLNGLYEQPSSSRVPLGLIPVGTGNAFARDLGLLAGDWERGIDIIARNNRQSLDVGRVEAREKTFYFLNILGLGFPADAMRTAGKWKRIGRSAYTLAVLREVMRLKSYLLDIEIDGVRLEQDNIFVEISNTRYTGTSFLIAPDAELDDGLLDVTLLRKLSRLRLLRLFPTIYSGRHVEFEEVSTYRARKITIRAPLASPMVPDGEFFGQSPATITCLKHDLEFFTEAE